MSSDKSSTKKKYALITGGSRGIGKAIALELADAGYNIILNYNSNTEEANKTALLLKNKGAEVLLMPFNVSDRKQVEESIGKWISDENNVLEILVNNAGIKKDGLLIWMKDDEWDSVVDTSLKGFYLVTQQILKSMLRRRRGRIVNVVSLSGLKGMPGQTNYSAAKAAVIGATKALAQEVGKRGITVNCVAPGFISTDMTEDLDEDQLKQHIPLNRFGTAEEVAKTVAFLTSEGAGYITGEVISINGGLYT